MRIYCIAILLFSFLAGSTAQETRFFMPAEIKRAYDNGTRGYDGAPGPKYWQNTADYRINVTVDPGAQRLTGEETVVYYNNSPRPLNQVVLRLYNNVYKKDAARRYDIDDSAVTEGVTLTSLAIAGKEIDLKARRRGLRTNGMLQYVPLSEPLAPGASVTLRLGWTTQIPKAGIRAGVSDSSAFFVAYWYPQVAVYDDVFGWDELQYNLQSEFYHGLANFDVTINAPDHYLVWATGELQNADAVYPAPVLARYRHARTSTSPVMVVGAADLTADAGYHNKSGAWRFRADEVSDFAFAVSDHYMWEAAAQPVDGRQVLISSVYPLERAQECTGLTALQQRSMDAMSTGMPGVPYPYPTFTTFIGTFGGGMEFPMMANNDGPNEGVTVHEMFHTYFPMYVRVNEKRFAWMDEGWATYGTDVIEQQIFKRDSLPVFSGGQQGIVGSLSDLPLITSTQFMDQSNYGYASYPLPGFVYSMLHHHLGDDVFYKCLREYIRRWAKKSPTPYDFFYTFENVSGRKLDWLWKPWFFEFGYSDLAIKSLNGQKLVVENRGTRPVPVHVGVRYENGQARHVYQDAAVWQKKSQVTLSLPKNGPISSVQLNPDIMDRTPTDNLYPTLAERYRRHPVAPGVAGTYRLQEFPAEVTLEWKDDALIFRLPEAGQNMTLVPQSATELESLDGGVKIKFNSDGSFQLEDFGYKLTAKKQ